MRDGCLAGAALQDFERHLRGCAACASELQALEALAEPLRVAAGSRALGDELHARRERARLLSSFAGASSRGRSRSLSLPLTAAGVAVLAAAVFFVWRGAPPATSAVVHADRSAVWSRQLAGSRETIVLERGVLSIHVEHRARGHDPVLVVLPDGELEDIGTTFTVSAERARTTQVAVQEGRVVLRLRGRTPVNLAAGETWSPEPQALAPPCAAPRIERVASETAPPPQPSAAGSTVRAPHPAPRQPARDFREAMAVFDRGRHREAAAAFANFLARHPGDARAEDAAYLQVIALQKCGAHSDMRAAAERYLERYPAGLRRADVAGLVASP